MYKRRERLQQIVSAIDPALLVHSRKYVRDYYYYIPTVKNEHTKDRIRNAFVAAGYTLVGHRTKTDKYDIEVSPSKRRVAIDPSKFYVADYDKFEIVLGPYDEAPDADQAAANEFGKEYFLSTTPYGVIRGESILFEAQRFDAIKCTIAI